MGKHMENHASAEAVKDNALGGLRGLRAVPSRRLLDAVSEAYGIDCRLKPVDLGGSSSLNLLVGEESDRRVVRVYRPYVTADRLRDVQLVRQNLSRAGVPCGEILPTREGLTWLAFEDWLAEMERYVEHDAYMNTWDGLNAGLPVLGRIHAVLNGLEIGASGRGPAFANHIEAEDVLERTRRGTRRIRS